MSITPVKISGIVPWIVFSFSWQSDASPPFTAICIGQWALFSFPVVPGFVPMVARPHLWLPLYILGFTVAFTFELDLLGHGIALNRYRSRLRLRCQCHATAGLPCSWFFQTFCFFFPVSESILKELHQWHWLQGDGVSSLDGISGSHWQEMRLM